MRILKGYGKETQKDFESLKRNSDYPLTLLTDDTFEGFCPSLSSLIMNAGPGEQEKQLLQDIADYVNDKAKFDEQLYYVKFTTYSANSYLNIRKYDSHLFVGNNGDTDGFQTQFTMNEIKDLGEKYVPFAIPVSEVNE